MTERNTRVLHVDGTHVTVGVEADAGCSGCRSQSLCGSGAAPRQHVLIAPPDLASSLRPGDAVALDIDDGVPMRAALLAYLPPMAGLLGGIVSGMIAGLPDGALLVCAAFGLAGGSAITRIGARRWHRTWHPHIRPQSGCAGR